MFFPGLSTGCSFCSSMIPGHAGMFPSLLPIFPFIPPFFQLCQCYVWRIL